MRALSGLSLCLISLSALPAAAGDWCSHSRDLSAEMDLRGVDRIEVLAVSGDLDIRGAAGLNRVSATGRACVDRKNRDRLDEIEIREERDGSLLRIIAHVPYRDDDDWRIGGLDLTLEVPATLPMTVSDSSGDLAIGNVASLELTDSSGDIDLTDIPGGVFIARDSSGDIDMRDVGDVRIDIDSSGDIDVRRAASLMVGTDTSGSIEASDILGDVTVGTDTSGDVRVADVGGNFTVEQDTSGDIRHRRVAGTVSTPDD